MQDKTKYCRNCEEAVTPLPSGTCPTCYETSGFSGPVTAAQQQALRETASSPLSGPDKFLVGVGAAVVLFLVIASALGVLKPQHYILGGIALVPAFSALAKR